jgi:DEAD/DEAH box helicase domain-containing protein
MRRITFDIETKGSFRGPMPDFSQLELTVVGIHDTHDDSYRCFTQEELGELWPILEQADLLIGFNSDHFDIPILNKYYAGDLTKIKSVDLLKEVKAVLNRRLRLDNLAEATLGKGKSGNGLDAVKWWEQGLVEKVKAYCLDDVRITKELYDYARKHGSLKYKELGTEELRDIKLDTSGWEKPGGASALTHTLPF